VTISFIDGFALIRAPAISRTTEKRPRNKKTAQKRGLVNVKSLFWTALNV
jgi:hypothetical protein